MDKASALAALHSRSLTERLEAARALMKLAQQDDLPVVRRALASEHVPWVISALERLIRKLEGADANHPDDWEQDAEFESDNEDSVRSETIGQLLHELTPAIGRLKMAAMTECDAYDDSKLSAEFEKLAQLIDLFGRWRRVNSRPRFTRVNIGELIQEVVEDEGVKGVPIIFNGDRSLCTIITDREYLKAALANGLRNAVQAVEMKGGARNGNEGVTLTYGVTDKEYWVAINDDGIGLQRDFEYIFKSTTTTKPGHSGLGLPIAREAVLKLGGKLSLTPSVRGGAKYLIEIPLREGAQ